MTWATTALTNILTEEFPAYKAAKRAGREKVLAGVRARLEDEAKATGVTLPKMLDKVKGCVIVQDPILKPGFAENQKLVSQPQASWTGQ